MNKVTLASIIVTLAIVGTCFVRSASANPAVIQNVVVSKIGNRYHLEITIYHVGDGVSDYVKKIRVNINYDQNITEMALSPQAVTPDHIFTVSYDLGQLPGDSAYVEVYAECTTASSWSDPWSGQIPELSLPFMLAGLVFATSVSLYFLRKRRTVNV